MSLSNDKTIDLADWAEKTSMSEAEIAIGIGRFLALKAEITGITQRLSIVCKEKEGVEK